MVIEPQQDGTINSPPKTRTKKTNSTVSNSSLHKHTHTTQNAPVSLRGRLLRPPAPVPRRLVHVMPLLVTPMVLAVLVAPLEAAPAPSTLLAAVSLLGTNKTMTRSAAAFRFRSWFGLGATVLFLNPRKTLFDFASVVSCGKC